MLTILMAIQAVGMRSGIAEDQNGEDGSRNNFEQSFKVRSSYQALSREDVLIENATILVGNGEWFDIGAVYVKDGRIAAIGKIPDVAKSVKRIDATDKWITPGLIDVHSHLGSYPTPAVGSLKDANEIFSHNTAGARMEDSVITQDAGFNLALAGGVTTLQLLPGSHNVFGGLGIVVKNVPANTVQEMKFPGAPYPLKMACGENPKRTHKDRRPITRMGTVLAMREAWIAARTYADSWRRYRENVGESEHPQIPERDLGNENLAGVLNGQVLVQMHCYRAEEMAVMLDVAAEFGFRIRAFHHASEAYKIADLLAENETCAVLFSDWWGFKMESYDAIPESMAFVHEAGGCSVIHSDSIMNGQYLNHEIAIALAAGQRAGLQLSRADAIAWVTLNAAAVLGLDDRIGSVETGKNADLVIWSGDPFSVYSKAEKVFIDGAIVYDRFDQNRQPISDFEIGHMLNVESEL